MLIFRSAPVVAQTDALTTKVKTVSPGGLAAQAGLVPGDRLIRVVTAKGHTIVKVCTPYLLIFPTR